MKLKPYALFSTLLFFIFSNLLAQMTEVEKIEEALYFIDENRFAEALPLLKEVHENGNINANINFNLGLCYFKNFHEGDKVLALPYLEKAVTDVSPNYTPFDPKEKKAPVEAWFYLGKAQHNDYQFDQAAESFNKFKTYINEKHFLWKEINKWLKMTNYAKVAIMNPVNIKSTNLGGRLNGFYPDFSPVIRIDESAVYFTSRRLREDSSNYEIYDPIDGMLYEDLYVSFHEGDSVWSEAYPLNINTDQHEATVNLSIDGQTLYIYKDIKGNGELFKSELLDDSAGYETWSEPEKLGSDINSKAYETHVTVTPDGKRLYFVSDREGGYGGKDIYYCNLLPTGEWALSQNLGPILNTEFNEDGVFMHPDGKTMYFSSDGHNSMGGYDIMYSVLTDSGWTKPQNIGYPINSVDDDVFFVTTPDGKRAYYSSFKEEGYGEKDIYLIELIDAEEIDLTLYRGEFTFVDRYVPPSGAQVTIINNYTGEQVGVYVPRQRDGQFSAILEPNNSYHFIYEADSYETYEEDIYVPAGASYQEIYKDIKLKPVRVGRGMDKITPAPLATADIKGGLIKDGLPMRGMKILLLNEQEDLLQETTSDHVGEFQFAKLDPSQTYLIRVITEDENPLMGYDVEVVNDQGEILVFEELDDTTYIFVPSTYPYEFYGISAKSIAGKVKKAGNPLEGLNVILENKDKDVIQQEVTDEYGEFNFQKLNLDEEYRIVFEGDFPDDPEIIITNDLGQEMQFIKEDEGIYKYVPPATEIPTQITGIAKKNGAPLAGLNVRLEDEGKTVLQEEETDEVGEFNFQRLNLDEEYRIVFEGDYPDDGEIVLLNEFGQELSFIKEAEGVYVYKPGPKIKLEDIAGAITANNEPVKNLKVLLYNRNDVLLNTASTDSVGNFNFMQLNLKEPYTIKFEGDYPEDVKLVVSNEDFDLLLFRKIDEGVYRYDPLFNVILVDKNESILREETTDKVDEFNYEKLNIDETYKIVFEGDFPDDEEIVIFNDQGQELVFKKIERNVYQYVPIEKETLFTLVDKNKDPVKVTGVRLEDENRTLLERINTTDLGKLTYRKLPLYNTYWLIFDQPTDYGEISLINGEEEELIFVQMTEYEYKYIPKNKYGVRSFTIDVRDNADFEETYPRPEELTNVIAYFQKYFIYNAKDINESNKEFVTFITDIVKMVEIRGYADIIITSSASKVPTKTWKTNSILTKRRAYDTKRLLETMFEKKGLSKDQYNFVDINTLITGPEYKYDFIENRTTYEKYQYVRIFVK
ncbi:MAG: hypothetical protein CMO34_05985 [Verrucomicrobia bacterium]|nr:hypothetical protein [Verrucomicrobiota bacterium]